MSHHLSFLKYHGSGNDFILLHRLPQELSAGILAQKLCQRHRSIGADGLLCLYDQEGVDAALSIYNADGSEPSFCGNGLLCAARYLYERIGVERPLISCPAGLFCCHHLPDSDGMSLLFLASREPPRRHELLSEATGLPCYWVHTGVPHLVLLSTRPLPTEQLTSLGRFVRHHESLSPEGSNATFCWQIDGQLQLCTYERGVEAITEACGSGAMAAALAAHCHWALLPPFTLMTKQGDPLQVQFRLVNDRVEALSLAAAATYSFSGEVFLPCELLVKSSVS